MQFVFAFGGFALILPTQFTRQLSVTNSIESRQFIYNLVLFLYFASRQFILLIKYYLFDFSQIPQVSK